MRTRDRTLGSSRTITLLVTLVLVSLSFILLSQNEQFAPVQSFLQNLASPVQRTVTDSTRQVQGWISTLQQMNTVRQENAQLRVELQRLQSENARLQDLRAENERLLRMLGFQDEFPELKTLPARVVGMDPDGTKQMMIIDRGYRHGIRDGMPVTSPGGFLVGRTIDTRESDARVLLVTDVDSSISVVIARDNMAIAGVMSGQAQHGGRLLVQHIPQGADVRRGDLIKTSGGSMPKGLLIGQISEVHQRDVEMEQAAEAYPLVELELATLEQVLVITGGAEENLAPDAGATPPPGVSPEPATPGPASPEGPGPGSEPTAPAAGGQP